MYLKAKSALCVLMSVLLCVCLAACDKNGGAGDTSLAGSEPRRESENLYAADLSSGESTASSADGSQQNSSLPGSSGALAGNSSKKTASNKTTQRRAHPKRPPRPRRPSQVRKRHLRRPLNRLAPLPPRLKTLTGAAILQANRGFCSL